MMMMMTVWCAHSNSGKLPSGTEWQKSVILQKNKALECADLRQLPVLLALHLDRRIQRGVRIDLRRIEQTQTHAS